MDPQPLQHDYPEDPGFTPEDLEPRPFTTPSRHRVLWTLAILILLILLAVLPPLVHVNSLQKQITTSISQSLGRPVHAGEVTLNLLPFPGFTLQNFTVSDDPAFSAEPVIRASSVMARLRWRSLWRRRVEFSRITLADASVNLVRRPDGKWNLESILLQASRMPAAPTAQRGPGDRPRFPYIEASGARLNLKMGLEKLPLSLTDADFALWLPQAGQWHLRLEAHPARTDAAVTDTGLLRLEGTLGRAPTLAEVPVDLHASWTSAPLGAASIVATGRDLGLRGELTLNSTLQGNVGDNAVTTRLRLDRVRRADFVPARLMDVDLTCTAHALANLHRLEDLHCAWPAGGTSSGLTITGDLPDTLTPVTASLTATLRQVPASGLLDLLRLATPRIAPDFAFDGTLSAQLTCCQPGEWVSSANLSITDATLTQANAPPFSSPSLTPNLTAAWANHQLQFAPIFLDLGGPRPVQLGAVVTPTGYQLTLTGLAQRTRLQQLATALPPFGDGLQPFYTPATPDPVNLNLQATRPWTGPQQWSSVAAPRPSPIHKQRHR